MSWDRLAGSEYRSWDFIGRSGIRDNQKQTLAYCSIRPFRLFEYSSVEVSKCRNDSRLLKC